MDHRSTCPLASALDIFGDRWTLIVLRMIFLGHRRYGDMLKMPEGISTNILADRLALLVREGILETVAYQDSPPRHEYRLTKKGADLLPVMLAMAKWSQAHIPGRVSPPDWLVASNPSDFYPKDGT